LVFSASASAARLDFKAGALLRLRRPAREAPSADEAIWADGDDD